MVASRFCAGATRRPAAILASAVTLGIWLICPVVATAQVQTAPTAQNPPPVAGPAAASQPSGESVTFSFANRPIVELRALVLGRRPSERAEGAARALNGLIAQGIRGPVEFSSFDAGTVITVGSRGVLTLTPPDIDQQSGETMQAAVAETVVRLQQALDEAFEARSVSALLFSGALAGAGLALGLLLLWGLARGHRAVVGRLVDIAEQKLTRSGITDLTSLRASRVLDFERGLLTSVTLSLGLVISYSMVTFVLRRFPYTRPWGESMRGYLLMAAGQLALGIVSALPGLFTVALIVVLTRFLIRLLGLWFTNVEQGRTHIAWMFPETAQPTRRLVTMLLWLFAIVVAYPYIPGSDTDAFKGVGVFIGLMMTFGSSGLVNQIMSGFMLTYSRAFRIGDFVRVGEVEGTVIHLGVLSVKVETIRGEEVTLPNAVVVAQTTTDYSRFADKGSVLTPTSVTIGYDAPWRQVEALLLLAADRTPGLRSTPKPIVLQTALQDFYVQYTLYVGLENQARRPWTLHDLHANIQDLFNEFGVQIMSPNYLLDPARPKIVDRKDWYAAPARPDP